jgi:hypothetical protein
MVLTDTTKIDFETYYVSYIEPHAYDLTEFYTRDNNILFSAYLQFFNSVGIEIEIHSDENNDILGYVLTKYSDGPKVTIHSNGPSNDLGFIQNELIEVANIEYNIMIN